MAFLDGVFNKPRANFEKSCSDFQLFALCDLTNVIKIKAKIIDCDKHLIQFFGKVKDVKEILANRFMYDNSRRILVIVPDTFATRNEEYIDNSKSIPYETTIAEFQIKNFALV